jgi:hypothetical protein
MFGRRAFVMSLRGEGERPPKGTVEILGTSTLNSGSSQADARCIKRGRLRPSSPFKGPPVYHGKGSSGAISPIGSGLPTCAMQRHGSCLGTSTNTVPFSRILIAFSIFTGGSGLSDLRRSGKLLIFRLTPRLLRRCPRRGKRSWRISSSAGCQACL